MPTFNASIKKLAKENTDFRRELVSNAHSQVVLICIEPGDDIGEETHATIDQWLVLVKGEGEVRLAGEISAVGKGSLIAVPAGTTHNVINTGDQPMKLFTLYAPPEHPPGTVHRTRADAIAAEDGSVRA